MAVQRVIVAGGGAAGLMAAGQAARLGAETLVLEKMSRPGRKLRISGKGRCNLTNTAELSEAISHFGLNGRFLRQAFFRFFNSELIVFFEELGLSTVTERGGRVFPAGACAQEVVDRLVAWVGECGVTIKTRSRVERLLVENGQVVGVEASCFSKRLNRAVRRRYSGNSTIVTTGGASYPATGSTGDGYGLAESVGHAIVPIRPSLVPLETAVPAAGQLDGLVLRNVNVRMLADGKMRARMFGEMMFTSFGVSGPVLLSLSRPVVEALRQDRKVFLSVDLKPALDARKLDARLLRDLDAQGRKPFRALLKGLLPGKLIPVAVEQTGIPAEKPGHQITADERKRLLFWLKHFRIGISGHRPLAEAIVTAGGVDTREVDPRTMASRLIQGLYFAGEVLDIDADTGGYNLQAAFSTGWLAGRSAAGWTP